MRAVTPVLVLLLLAPLAAAGVHATGGVPIVFLSKPAVVTLEECSDPSREITTVAADSDGATLTWALSVLDRTQTIRCAGDLAGEPIAPATTLDNSNVGARFEVSGPGNVRVISHLVADSPTRSSTVACVLFIFKDGTSDTDCLPTEADPVEPALSIALQGRTPGRQVAYDLRGSTLTYTGFAVAAYDSVPRSVGFMSVAQTGSPGEISV